MITLNVCISVYNPPVIVRWLALFVPQEKIHHIFSQLHQAVADLLLTLKYDHDSDIVLQLLSQSSCILSR